MNDFANDPRRQQELAGRELADAIYRSVLHATDIRRFDNEAEECHLLDRKYAIDVELELPTRMVLTAQEKFLSQEHSHYNSLTIEHLQNPETGEMGDWGKLAAQLYMVAYFTAAKDTFEKWAILDVAALSIATELGKVPWHDNRNKDGKARSTFRWVNVAELPKRCVWFQHGFRSDLAA